MTLAEIESAMRTAIDSFNNKSNSATKLQFAVLSRDNAAGQVVCELKNIVPTRDISSICEMVKTAIYPCYASFPINDPHMTQLTCVVSLPRLDTVGPTGAPLQAVVSRRSGFCCSLCKFCGICTAVTVACVGIGIAVLNFVFPLPQSIRVA